MNVTYLDEIVTDKRIELPNGKIRQVAALVYRTKKSKTEILLVTSRGTGRWVLPKGWPQVRKTFAQSARTEAYEEAGARGDVAPFSIGTYTYKKSDMCDGENGDFIVDVFPMHFSRQEKNWPERGQRRIEWMSVAAAAECVDEPELRELIASFDPAILDLH
ncbi:8-oxo-dGTP pyrophosphatase MutT, NUDIX family [Phyllobacterium sp. YR620]|uniref:NUDIX hydrolase n=1 Tax=Phyllobacterium pellucidum TaxID=2740464 RepID=A0A849VU81_9HYPH|nr:MULTISPECIES: NUDIX hydrolase [Phyllobacterium]MRG57246.1 NUDIX domain-containing protein [Phyllobacterium sp. SYP-B3895]NTS31403.1 NUDIX hydrolase [Phyllobacterium pellucidum]UGY08878.1 NUDIX hydrolase [Phyllobacterium sp. T1018]SDP05761.1 8-oxo-dGTP pyrophosphatase MutT, NUDIX family [Phyllobacterium sp. YR620]SFI95242.1 8-oxo-dGTP pyrophosphatase MutT, NUDIX family [Phyllobacterium sp. CL33Tsu]